MLEVLPHNWVHGIVGGWMGDVVTAARDPIFWLHHANIDRLWEAWVALGDPDDPDNRNFRNPSATRWHNMWFKVGDGASAVTLRVREVLNTTRPPLNYRYSNISVPSVPAPAPAAVLAASPGTEKPIPELVGASESRTPLAATPTEVEVAIGAPSGPALMAERAEGAQPRKVYLKVENVRGTMFTALSYLVHVNLPPGVDPTTNEDRLAGHVTMFGVREASEPREEHGSGLTFAFDITGVVQRLQETGEWDPERLRVTFTPFDAGAAQGGDVSVGRVSLFYA